LRKCNLQNCQNAFSARVGLSTHSDICSYMYAADTRFYTAYILSARLFKCRCAARQTVVSAEWERWGKKQGNREKAAAVKGIILDDEFWAAIKIFCRLVKPIVRLMRLVDSNMPTMGKVELLPAHVRVFDSTFWACH
jgi:hypothetical protein